MGKKLLSILSMLLLLQVAVHAQTATVPSGTGTSGAPYEIATLDNLYWLSQTSSAWGSYFIQTADIDASTTSGWNSGAGLATIGDDANDFTGTYDGKGHTISGLYINRSARDYVGFFGSIKGATIKNLGLVNASIIGAQYVGGLVGYAYSNASTISNCFSTGTVSGTVSVGGLIGYTDNNNFLVSNCYSHCSVSGTSSVGGFIGTINNQSSISNCYSKGAVSGSTDIGGFVGTNSSSGYGVVANCFWDTQTSGQSSSPNGIGKTTALMQTASTFTSASWSSSDWSFADGSYPKLLWQLKAPTVTTQAVSNIAATTATGNGNITSLGSPNPTAYGVCWNTTGMPTTSDSKVDKGTASATGAFTASMTGLTANTTYYVRAYATNAVGTSYGDVVSFVTSADNMIITSTDFTSGDDIAAFDKAYKSTTFTITPVSHSYSDIETNSGFDGFYSYDYSTANGTVFTISALGYSFDLSSFKYYLESDRLPSLTVTLTFIDGSTDTKTYSFTGASTGVYTFSSFTTTPNDVKSIKFASDNYMTFNNFAVDDIKALPIVPTVSTASITTYNATSATVGGNITADGGATVTDRGVVYSSTDATPTIGESGVTQDANGSGTGSFSESITLLSPSTTYYVRAYATNSIGTSYGSVVSFTTTTPPSISSVSPPSSATYVAGEDLDYTVSFSETVDVVTTNGTPYLTLTIGGSTVHASYQSGSGTTALTFRYTAASGDHDADGAALASNVTLNGGTIKDDAGNDAALAFTGSTAEGVLVDAVAPTISGVTGPSVGTYAIGGDLDFTVTASEIVTVTGSPYIAVTVGGVAKHAVYVSGTGTSSSLVFRYTLVSGDEGTLASGSAITLGSATIKDAAGNDLSSTSFTAPSVSGVTIDAVAPSISSVTPPGNATYIIGQNLDYTVSFSEAVDVVTTNGTPYLTLTIGGSTVHASYQSGSGTTALTFRYTAASGDHDADGAALASNVTLNGGTIKDAAGNDAALAFTGSTAEGVLVDAVAPTISGVTGPSAGTYAIGGDLDFTVTASEIVTVTGSPYIAVTVGGVAKHAVYVSGTGTSSLVFRYTLVSGDEGPLASGSAITLGSATIKDAAGNALASTDFTAPTVSAVSIDAVAPTIAAVTGPSAGTYASGDTLWFSVAFGEDVTVSGTPFIGLTIGSAARRALYVSGSGTGTLKFGYEVASGDEDADGIGVDASVSLNEGSIADDAGNAALLDLGTLGTEDVFVNNQPTIMVQKNFDPAGYSLRSVSSSGLFHVELPADAHHAEIILLDAAGRRLAAKSLDVSSSSMDVQLQSPACWNLAILRVDGHVKASARGGVPLR